MNVRCSEASLAASPGILLDSSRIRCGLSVSGDHLPGEAGRGAAKASFTAPGAVKASSAARRRAAQDDVDGGARPWAVRGKGALEVVRTWTTTAGRGRKGVRQTARWGPAATEQTPPVCPPKSGIQPLRHDPSCTASTRLARVLSACDEHARHPRRRGWES